MRKYNWISVPFLTVLLLLSQLTVTAQQPNPHKEKVHKDDEVIVSSYPIISIDALVLSGLSGSVVSDLTHYDFAILENDIQQDIFAWRRPPAPLSLLIIVDTASADANSNSLDNRVSALKSSFIGALDSRDEVSIMVLAERPILLQDYTSNKHLINAALDRVVQHRLASKLPVENRVSRGLQEAAEHARSVQNSEARHAIILISDLAERVGDLPVSPEAVRAVVEPLPAIFCWNRATPLAPQVFYESQYSLNNVSLSTLVGLTGGEFVNSDWKTFIERMRGRYSIAYLPSARQRQGQVVRIKVVLKPSAKRDTSDLVVTYPRVAIIPSVK